MRIYEEITPEMINSDLRYLELLSHNFPSIASASTEIINLEAILTFRKEQNISWQTCMGNTKLSNMY